MPKIAVFFPGTGYNCDKPLLYYARKASKEIGFEKQICIEYSYDFTTIDSIDALKTTLPELLNQAEEQLGNISWREYDDICFVGKSLGTALAAEYISRHNLSCAKQVWLTPIAPAFEVATYNNTIAFIGTKDQASDISEIKQLSEKMAIKLSIYDGCNHSLECENVERNIDVLADATRKIVNFIC